MLVIKPSARSSWLWLDLKSMNLSWWLWSSIMNVVVKDAPVFPLLKESLWRLWSVWTFLRDRDSSMASQFSSFCFYVGSSSCFSVLPASLTHLCSVSHLSSTLSSVCLCSCISGLSRVCLAPLYFSSWIPLILTAHWLSSQHLQQINVVTWCEALKFEFSFFLWQDDCHYHHFYIFQRTIKPVFGRIHGNSIKALGNLFISFCYLASGHHGSRLSEAVQTFPSSSWEILRYSQAWWDV